MSKNLTWVQTDFKHLWCDRCNMKVDMPNRVPLPMIEDYLKSFGKLHKKCLPGSKNPHPMVELELQKGSG